MYLYQKHILNLLARFYGAVTSTFLIIVILGQFIKLLNKYIGKGGDILQVFFAILLAAPDILVKVSPIALFCSIIAAHHKLSSDNELVILESSGLSKYRLAKVFLLFAGIITTLNLVITLTISPLAMQKLKKHTTRIQDNYVSNMLEEGVFNNVSNSMTIYIDKKTKNDNLRGVVIYDNSNNQQIITSAESARFVSSKGNMKLIMFNGTRQQINEQGMLDILYFKQSRFNLISSDTTKPNRYKSEQELTIPDLIPRILNSSNKQAAERELHKRLSSPLLNMMLAAIALLSAFSANFSRKWSSKTIFSGSILAISSIILFFSISSSASNNSFMNIVNYIFIFFTTYICMYILNRLSSQNTSIKEIFKKLINSYKYAKKL